MLFAQLQAVPADHLRNELLIAGALLGALGTIAAIVFGILHAVRAGRARAANITPVPLPVVQEPRAVQETEFATRTAGMEQRLEALEHGLVEVQRVQREQLGNVHRRIDDMLQVVSRLGGVIEGVQEALRNLHHDLLALRKK